MSKLSFVKYEGAGNDFILIDDRALLFPIHDKERIQLLCHRRFGIGADGIILLQHDKVADFRMRIFNSDGSEAESCGNGIRCFKLFISDLGLQATRIATGSRIVEATFEGDKIGVQMGMARDLRLHLQIDGKEIHSVDTGVPHAVQFVEDVDQIDIQKEGSSLRHHSFFQPKGTNVNFAELQNDGSIRVRTFERGVEGETLACGTGATAVAAVASQIYQLPSPISLCFQGGTLEIHFKDHFKDKGLSDLKMVGPARRVFSGVLND